MRGRILATCLIKKQLITVLVALLILHYVNSGSEGSAAILIAEKPMKPGEGQNKAAGRNTNSRPGDDDWLINQTMVIENETLSLTGNMVILADGNLTLRHVVLQLDEMGSPYHIEVHGEGVLTIEAGSTVTARLHHQTYILRAHPNSTIDLRDSMFHYSTVIYELSDFEGFGFWIQTDEAHIINCTIRGDSNIQFSQYATHSQFDYAIVLEQADNGLITNNTIIGSSWGIRLNHCDFTTISGNNLSKGVLYGIRVENSSNCSLQSNFVRDFIVGISLRYSPFAEIHNNVIEQGGAGIGGGIHVGSSEYCIISNCRLININGSGISLRTSPNNVISNNSIKNCVRNGVSLESSSYCVIFNNEVFQLDSNGIHLLLSNNNTLKNNSVIDCRNTGISLSNSPNNTISGNTILNNKGGIEVGGGGGCVIANNTIKNSSDHGIYIGSSDQCVVIDNTIENSGNCGIYFHEVSHGVIAENVVDSSSSIGIAVRGDDDEDYGHNTVNKNRVSNSGEYGIFLGWTNHDTVKNNVITHSGDYGIYIRDSEDYKLANNTISDSGKKDVYKEGDFFGSPAFALIALIGLPGFFLIVLIGLFGFLILTRKKA
jgi:parallel beta-helix repeat protein